MSDETTAPVWRLFGMAMKSSRRVVAGMRAKSHGRLILRFFPARNDRLDAARFEARKESVCVVALVAKERLRLKFGGRRLSLFDVVNVAASEVQRERVAQSVDDDMNLGGKAAPRSPYGLDKTCFFRALALC